MEDTVAAAKAKEAEEAAKMAEAQKDISANATKGLPICDENNGHCAIPKEFGPNSKGAKQAEVAKKKAEEATRKARKTLTLTLTPTLIQTLALALALALALTLTLTPTLP